MEDIEDVDDDDESRFLRHDLRMGGILIRFVAGVWMGVLDPSGAWIGVLDLVGGCRLGSLDLDEVGGRWSEVLRDREEDIRRTTSSSGLRSGRGTPPILGARGVPEPAEGFDFVKDMIVRS